jgi:hypothetical protein
MTYDLIIIGAGAAGLFAAANVPVGRKVLVLEKTGAAGQKLLLTGSGQCNLTNNDSIKSFLLRYGENGKRLRPVLFPFSNIALIGFFEQHGLPLYVREDGKVFPASTKSTDVLTLLLKLGRERGVTFRYNSDVTDISVRNKDGCCGYLIKTTEAEFYTKTLLVATGGMSYPQTGSDGSCFSCLERLGIELVPRRPALTPIFVSDYPYGKLSGLTFPDVTIELKKANNKKSVKVESSLLFTHKGLSGLAILEISRYVSQGDRLVINYLPKSFSPKEACEALHFVLLQSATGSTKQIITILESVTKLARSFLEHICRLSDIAPDEKASRLSGHQMNILAKRITADTLEISGTGGFSAAMATAGGVSLGEVHLRTMEALRFKNLYFAGEVLDVDGDTGGYNLQFAFSSAMCALKSMR